jgi:hypothetical protein
MLSNINHSIVNITHNRVMELSIPSTEYDVNTSGHIIGKLLKIKDKEKFLKVAGHA